MYQDTGKFSKECIRNARRKSIEQLTNKSFKPINQNLSRNVGGIAHSEITYDCQSDRQSTCRHNQSLNQTLLHM
jgi:hypothetical protein